MAKRRKKTTTRRKTPRRKRKTSNKRTMKRKLAGFTKTKGKFALVFKKGKTLSIGKGRFKNKKSLEKAARKHIK